MKSYRGAIVVQTHISNTIFIGETENLCSEEEATSMHNHAHYNIIFVYVIAIYITILRIVLYVYNTIIYCLVVQRWCKQNLTDI